MLKKCQCKKMYTEWFTKHWLLLTLVTSNLINYGFYNFSEFLSTIFLTTRNIYFVYYLKLLFFDGKNLFFFSNENQADEFFENVYRSKLKLELLVIFGLLNFWINNIYMLKIMYFS